MSLGVHPLFAFDLAQAHHSTNFAMVFAGYTLIPLLAVLVLR